MNQSGNIKPINFESTAVDESKMDHVLENIESNVKFDPSQFFIPGWKGEGLITSHGLQIKSVLNNLTIDATSLFKKLCTSTNTMKKQTYAEFMEYAKWSKLDLSAFNQPSDFWFHFQDETSPYQIQIQEFIRLFCFRAVAIYLFRIKFILDLSRELKLEISEDTLFNPLSFLGRIFKKNSSTELQCESLQINQYSWYRPTHEYKESLVKIQESFFNVTLTELIKLLSTPKEYKIYSVKNYSHSLSHLSFGLFISDLMIQFPKWINSEEKPIFKDNFYNQKTCILPNTINTKFEGNHISSLALSHWLAQEASIKHSQWDNIICPDFSGNEFIDGVFLKICQELQFLSFLTKVAVEHSYEVVPFICKIMKDKSMSKAEDTFDQISLLDLAENNNTSKFNRIVLNLLDSPKTNPHHHLITQILNKKSDLKKDGVLYVLSNQKLFVPSHSERVELLLKDFKLIASFNLDDLKGKGEIPHYIYILKKREQTKKVTPHLFKVNRQEKESCLTFQLKGNLSRFNKFNKIVEEFQNFLKNKKVNSTPIYINEIDPEISFEFHVDAIIEGKLVSSTTNKEIGQTPHPSFFKNLTKTSVSLDAFFHLDNINPFEDSEKNITNELLGIKSSFNRHYPLLLIINQSNPIKVEIDLVPFESFKAKVEEHGTAYFTYFGLSPKHSSINLNVFREYFNSMIGYQIIQMQLSDGPNKLKGKLKSLLIPSFFTKTQFMPNELVHSFDLLEKEPNDLLKLHPDDLNKKFENIESHFEKVKSNYPWHLLGLLSHFKLNLKNSISDIETNNVNDDIQFSNPIIAKELVALKTFLVYPKNKDIYVNIDTKNPSDLHLPLTSISTKVENENNVLTIFSNEKAIVTLYSSANMISFIKFILSNATGVKIADILLGLRVPSIIELDSVILKFSIIKDNKVTLLKKTNHLISRIFLEQISN